MRKIFVFLLAGIMMFSMTACGANSSEDYASLGAEEFCNELWLQIDQNVEDSTVEALDVLSSEERTFYILSDFNFHFQCGGLATYLYNTQGVYASQVGEQLKSLELDEMAKIYDDFFVENDVDLSDFLNDELDYEALSEKYPLDAFDEEFYACYEKTDLNEILADYGRKHILDDYL